MSVDATQAINAPAATWLAYNEAENARDFAAMGRLIAPDLSVTVNGVPAVASAEDDLETMGALIATYPDYRREVDETFEAGTRVVARWRMRGTALNEDTPALDVSGCSVVDVHDGLMTAAHLYYDGTALDAVIAAARG